MSIDDELLALIAGNGNAVEVALKPGPNSNGDDFTQALSSMFAEDNAALDTEVALMLQEEVRRPVQVPPNLPLHSIWRTEDVDETPVGAPEVSSDLQDLFMTSEIRDALRSLPRAAQARSQSRDYQIERRATSRFDLPRPVDVSSIRKTAQETVASPPVDRSHNYSIYQHILSDS